MKRQLTYIFLLFTAITLAQNITSEEVLIKNDSIELPGTLTYTTTQSPLVIWVHGSGNVDRNGNQGDLIKGNYIKQFRGALNNENISFFSYDKRTATAKNFKFLKGILYEDLVNDVKKVVAHFKNDTRFNQIILIGHSQGSLTAMLALEDIAKYISIAGPGNTIDKTMIAQISKQNSALGEIAKAHFKELSETGKIAQVNPFLASIFSKQNLPFIASWAKYNPVNEIKKVTIPTLLINGTKDIQVKTEDAKLLHQAKPNASLVIINNMNHVLKHIEKDADNMKSYYSPDYALSKELITTIVGFIKK